MNNLHEKLDQHTVTVELPPDIAAKHQAKQRMQGNEIHDSLYKGIREMEKMKRMGAEYPKELESKLLGMTPAEV